MRDFLKLLGKSFAIVFGSGLALLLLAGIVGLAALGVWHRLERGPNNSKLAAASASASGQTVARSVLFYSARGRPILNLDYLPGLDGPWDVVMPNGTTVTRVPAGTTQTQLRCFWNSLKPWKQYARTIAYEPCAPKEAAAPPQNSATVGTPVKTVSPAWLTGPANRKGIVVPNYLASLLRYECPHVYAGIPDYELAEYFLHDYPKFTFLAKEAPNSYPVDFIPDDFPAAPKACSVVPR